MSLNDVGIYLGDGPFEFDIGMVNLNPFQGTHWVAYINENYSDSYGWSPPQKLSEFNIKRIGHCLFSGNKIQGLTSKQGSLCAS